MTPRDKAAAICRKASQSVAESAKHYAIHAQELGYAVEFEPNQYGGNTTGPDTEAVELASIAWLKVDPEAHGIESVEDPRRDVLAAELIESGAELEW